VIAEKVKAPVSAVTENEGRKNVDAARRDRHSDNPPPRKLQDRPLVEVCQDFEERERSRFLATLRVRRIRLQLELAEIDAVGCLVRDGLMSPATGFDWLENPGAPHIEGECREVTA
jgi:hypothetical protein